MQVVDLPRQIVQGARPETPEVVREARDDDTAGRWSAPGETPPPQEQARSQGATSVAITRIAGSATGSLTPYPAHLHDRGDAAFRCHHL